MSPAPRAGTGRIRVLGEAIVDLVGAARRSNPQAGPDQRSAPTYTAHPGGSPANVAVDLARLEIPVTLHGRISTDSFGRLLRDHLTTHQVDLGGVVAADEPSTLAVATVDERGVASYDFWTTGTADWQWRPGDLPQQLPADTLALHTGSLASWLEPSATPVADLLEREHTRGRVTLSLDPNCRPALQSSPERALPWIERLVGLVDLVKVSEEDLAWLLPGTPVEEVADRWLSLGASLVVVTLGARGAYGRTNQVSVTVPPAPVTVVDTIGAGDAFTAGLLAGLYRADLLGAGAGRLGELSEPTLRTLLGEAALVAGLTCARSGALGPTRADLPA